MYDNYAANDALRLNVRRIEVWKNEAKRTRIRGFPVQNLSAGGGSREKIILPPYPININ